MNDFVDAIKNNSNSSSEDASNENQGNPSSERYDELKKEEADVDRGTPAEKRYQEIKDKAKREMIEKEKEHESEAQEEDNDDDENSGFVTH